MKEKINVNLSFPRLTKKFTWLRPAEELLSLLHSKHQAERGLLSLPCSGDEEDREEVIWSSRTSLCSSPRPTSQPGLVSARVTEINSSSYWVTLDRDWISKIQTRERLADNEDVNINQVQSPQTGILIMDSGSSCRGIIDL